MAAMAAMAALRSRTSAPQLIRAATVAIETGLSNVVPGPASLSSVPTYRRSETDVSETVSSKHSGSAPAQNCFRRIESNPYFQNFTLLIVCVNTIWIFIDVEWNNEKLRREDGSLPLEPASIIMENIFCSYFSLELLIRFLAVRRCCLMFRDRWLMFDTILVSMMVLETWILPVAAAIQGTSTANGNLSRVSSLRILRLLRLTRMARLMRYSPELMTIVKGMLKALQTVSFIILFIFVNIWIFAIIFVNQLGEPGYQDPPGLANPSAKLLMSDLGSAMMTLVTFGVFGDNLAQIYDALRLESIWYVYLFALFEVITGVTLLNMLTGALCQVIEETSQEEAESRQVAELRVCLEQAFRAVDVSNDGQICEEEWSRIKDNPKVRGALQQLGIGDNDVEDRLLQMQETLFGTTTLDEDKDEETETSEQPPARENGLSFEEFAEKLVELRWDTPASTLDVEMLKTRIVEEDRNFKRKFDTVEARLARLFLGHGASQSLGGDRFPSPERKGRWLQEVPTDQLLQALRNRPLPPQSASCGADWSSKGSKSSRVAP